MPSKLPSWRGLLQIAHSLDAEPLALLALLAPFVAPAVLSRFGCRLRRPRELSPVSRDPSILRRHENLESPEYAGASGDVNGRGGSVFRKLGSSPAALRPCMMPS